MDIGHAKYTNQKYMRVCCLPVFAYLYIALVWQMPADVHVTCSDFYSIALCLICVLGGNNCYCE